jgi:hypothetical protein
MATGDIIYMTQDDMVLPPNMLSAHADWHARYDYPIAVYNKVLGAFSDDDAKQENDMWERLMDSNVTPIRGRWRYGSGHSFSYPTWTNVRLNPAYGIRYGFEDICMSRQIHNAGVWFYFDREVIAVHQPLGGSAWDRREKGKEPFYEWLHGRSINRRLFAEIHGFCPEYGTWLEGLG